MQRLAPILGVWLIASAAAAQSDSRLEKADAYRRSLLESGEGRVVGELVQAFAEQYPAPLEGRPAIGHFGITAERFGAQLRGADVIGPEEAFAPFAGRWYGVWDKKRVDHNWHGVDLAGPGSTSAGLVATQKAWVGDGWGWNYLIRPESSAKPGASAGYVALSTIEQPHSGAVVLGYVEMLNHQDPAGDPSDIRDTFPLVGYADAPGRLIWVTPAFVFFEEVFGTGDEQRYAITGFQYEWREDRCAAVVGDGFQAMYTRMPDNRPPFLRFPIDLAATAAPDRP